MNYNMNILVIGNGFDLTHGLPTKYTDFLLFCKVIIKIYTAGKEKDVEDSWWELKIVLNKNTRRLRKLFKKLYSTRKINKFRIVDAFTVNTNTIYDEFYDNIKYNIWIDYFLQNLQYIKENWIDFESEISKLIQLLDNDMRSDLSGNCSIENKIRNLSCDFLDRRYDNNHENHFTISFKQIRDDLQRDLLKLIRALEIYLANYVERIECNSISPDIKNIKVNKVLSFNYTSTYEKIYGNSGIEFDYIHGKSNIKNTIQKNNMVLGIDEYLSLDRRNVDLEFIAFKKFYQRIHKQTGCKYKEWVDEIKQDYFDYLQRQEVARQREQRYIPESMQRMMNELSASVMKEEKYSLHNLYIFGHSLDITDKDILRDLILNDNVYTTIYYLNKDVMGQQIANLVKVIGQDELIKRTGGNTKTIEFKQQQDMVKNHEGKLH